MKRTMGSKNKKQARPTIRPSEAKVKALWQGKIEKLAWGGLGVGRSEDGKLVLLRAPMALFPGEIVEGEVHWKSRHGEGEVKRWIQKDPRRVQPACPVAEHCGGCELWGAGKHTSALKKEIIDDLLRRQLPNQAYEYVEAPPHACRHRIQLHWNRTTLGFHKRKSHSIIPIKNCPVAAPVLSKAIENLQEALEASILPNRSLRWELATGTPEQTVYASLEDGRAWKLECDGWKPTKEGILHTFGDVSLRHRAGGFFQVCAPWAMEAFGQCLTEWELSGETLYDLYGGVGLFSALLGKKFQKRVLVEADEAAVTWARKNLHNMGLDSECLAEDAETWLPSGLGNAVDLILADPPRAGLSPVMLEKLLSAKAGKLVLVGCDGAAFCRDIQRLTAPGSPWALRHLKALDLFPMTSHAEFIALLENKSL